MVKKKNKTKRLSAISVLRDKFVPEQLRRINEVPVAARWVLRGEGGGLGPDDSSNDMNMETVISKMAANFIPRLPCTCGQGPESIHGANLYEPSPVHRVPPDFSFALRETCRGSNYGPYSKRYLFQAADLDETTSIREYSSTFRNALREEHEERMKLYEKYSLYKLCLRRMDSPLGNRASIVMEGLADARPAIQVSDIVLLRPIQPLVSLVPDNTWGMVPSHTYTIEIESRVLQIVRERGGVPDQVIISWDLNPEQRDALRDPAWVMEYTIRFIPSATVVERCLTALDWLDSLTFPQQEALKEILFPVNAPVVKKLTPEQRQVFRAVPAVREPQLDASDIGKPLNDDQASFVTMVRARTLDPSFEMARPPMILTGPAGTGKTKTLIYAIADVLGLLRHGPKQQNQNYNRVLLCCPSHAASDVLTRRLSGLLGHHEVFRMYDSYRPSHTVPGYILPFTCQVPGSDRFTLPSPSVWTSLRVVICTCTDAHLLYHAQITNYAIRVKQECFRSFLLSLPGSSPLGLTIGNVTTVKGTPFFTHLFIDEAAQATEPEILCPISCVLDPHFGGRKAEIALIGDPRQLSPRVFSNRVSDSLGRSFMERLLRRPVTSLGGGEESLLGPSVCPDHLLDNGESLTDLIRYYASVDGQEHLTVFLTQNYRGHPAFLMMPSSFFYFDRLRSAKKPDINTLAVWCQKLREVERLAIPVGVSVDGPITGGMSSFAQIHRQATWPIHFRGVKGKDTSDAIENFSGTDSWKNLTEANVVLDIVTTLIQNGVEQNRIGVMSPFRGQVVAIRKLLRQMYFHDVNVGTIENYQAVEQDVIVLSLTRTSSEFVAHDIERRMGIFGQPKQANVAMTRAENLFIVVGHPDTMWTDACWRQWLRFCYRNGLWFGSGLKQWEKAPTVSWNGMKFVSTLDLSNGAEEGNNSLVVSTLEKINRLHHAQSM